MPQVVWPALQKDSNINYSICCVLSFCNLGSWGGGTDGETISSAQSWVKEHLPLWVTTFLGHFLNRSCQSLSCLQWATRALSKHTSSLCAKVCKKRRPQLSGIKHQTSPTMHCFPHSSPRKPRLPVFIRTLITQSKSPGLQFPLQRRCWLLCWRWSLIIWVMSGWYVPLAGITAGGGSLAEWGHRHAARAEGWKKGFLAVLCPCGETTSKRSRASHFWVSPQMLFEKVPAAANCDGGFRAVSTSNWNQGNLWDLVLWGDKRRNVYVALHYMPLESQ